MMDDHLDVAERRRPFSEVQLARLAAAVDRDARALDARPLIGGIDTATYALRLSTPRSDTSVVVRVYRGWEGDVPEKVRQEYAILETISSAMALAPRPIVCDATGVLVGEPLIVMSWIEGAPLPPLGAAEPPWIEQFTDALIALHSMPLARASAIPKDRSPAELLARRLADPPSRPDPLWDDVTRAASDLVGDLTRNPSVVLHGDYWFGNTVWAQGRLRGVIDWDGARIGDPARDVAIASADLRLFGVPDRAGALRRRYEAARGPLNDMLFWDLLAALDPIRWLAHWIAGYDELGVGISLADARANLERTVRDDLRRAAEPQDA